MLAQAHHLDSLTPKNLDHYLEQGWFRAGQTIFTTHFLKFNEVFYSAIWLRIPLADFEPSKTQQKLQKQNTHFKVEIQALSLSVEQQNLFLVYREQVEFSISGSLRSLLFRNLDNTDNIFESYEVNIYDGEKLIASGVFDLGETASTGITCFYDPAYKKYSLGKYLMLQKILFSKQRGFQFFYPGYVAPNYRLFDYKLDLAKNIQFLNLADKHWLPIQAFDKIQTPIRIISEKLKQLKNVFDSVEIKSKLFYYDFFDAALWEDFRERNSFEYPVFLRCMPDTEDIARSPIVVYDVQDGRFHFFQCKSILKTIKENTNTVFSKDFLAPTYLFYSTPSVGEMAAQIMAILLGIENKK